MIKKIFLILLIILWPVFALATYDTVLTGDNPGPGDNSKMRIIFVPVNWSAGAWGSYANGQDDTFLGEVYNLVNTTDGVLWDTDWFNTNKANFDIYYVTTTGDSPYNISDFDVIVNGVDSLTTSALNRKFSYSRTTTNVHVELDNATGCSESQTNGRIYACRDSSSYSVFAHEFAHAIIGRLDDEYPGSASFQGNHCDSLDGGLCDGLSKTAPNISDKATNELWEAYVGYDSNAPFTGARYCDGILWRPTESSIMYDTTGSYQFDAFGSHLMDLGLEKRLGTKGYTQPTVNVTGITAGETKSGAFTATATITPNVGGATALHAIFYLAKSGYTSRSIKFDKNSPFTCWIDTTKYENGDYYLDVVGWDSYYNYYRESINFTISNSSTLSVPLYVMESLFDTNNFSGVTRSAEPVVFGVPIAKGKVSDASDLQLSGANAPTDYDIRTLGTWSDGSIRAVEVSFIVGTDSDSDTGEVIDSNLSLTTGGSLNSISSDSYTVYSTQAGGMATDDSPSEGYIRVNTGSAVFDIKKANHNGIDKVTIGADTVVSSAGTGGVYMNDSTTIYSSIYDANSTAIIEQNGYTHAVVKASGEIKSSGGTRLMWFTVRYHFYRGETAVRALVTLRLANSAENNHKTFRGAEFRTILNLSDTKTYKFQTSEGDYSANFTDANPAYLAQHFSHKYNHYGSNSIVGFYQGDENTMNDDDPLIFNQSYEGIACIYGGTTHNAVDNDDAATRREEYTKDYCQLYDSNGFGAIAGMRYAAGFFPMGFELYADGTLNVEIYSNNCTYSDPDKTFHVGCHQTREIWLQFHTSAPDSDALNLFAYRMNMPMYGISDFEYLRKTGFLYGRTDLATTEEEADWHDIHSYTLNNLGDDTDRVDVWRHYDLASAGGNYDHGYINLTQFLRATPGDNSQKINQIWLICRLLADVCSRRSDGEEYSVLYNEIRYGVGSYGASDSATGPTLPDFYMWAEWDLEHLKLAALAPFYYITGEEMFKEAFDDFGEYIDWHETAADDWEIDNLRPLTETLKSEAYIYWFNRDAGLKADLLSSLESLLESRYAHASTFGWSETRGFYNGGVGGGDTSCLKYNMEGKYFPQAIADVYWVLRDELTDTGYARFGDLTDYILGNAQFLSREWLELDTTDEYYYRRYDSSGTCTDNQFYNVDGTSSAGTSAIAIHSCSHALAVGLNVRDDWSILRLTEVNTNDYEPHDGHWGTSTWTTNICEEVGYLDMIYQRMTWRNFWKRVYFESVSLGSNQWKITFTVPDNASAYRIKWYPSKQIVDWLDYNPATQTFGYATANYQPYAFAYHYDSEPSPSAEGSTQEIIVTLDNAAITSYNSIRSLTSGDGGYVDFSADVDGKDIYFEVEYLRGDGEGGGSSYPSSDGGSVFGGSLQ